MDGEVSSAGYKGNISAQKGKKNKWFEGRRGMPINIENEGKAEKDSGFLSYFKEYCNSSGVHGFRYLFEERRTRLERMFWVTALVLCAAGCLRMVLEIKAKLESTPVIVSFADRPTNIWQIPFPAVTICPMTKTRQTVFNSSRYVDSVIDKSSAFAKDFAKWLKDFKPSEDPHEYDTDDFSDTDESLLLENSTMRNSIYRKLYAVLNLCKVYEWDDADGYRSLDDHAIEFLLQVAPKMSTGQSYPNNFMVLNAKHVDLGVFFKHTWTQYGLCFTFNMMDNNYVYNDGVVNNDIFKEKGLDQNSPQSSNDWDPDKAYSTTSKRQTYPWRGSFGSDNNGLEVVMMEDPDDRDECFGRSALGYNVILHQPQDHPYSFHSNVVFVSYQTLTDVLLKPDVMITSPELEEYEPHKRQCYYSYEKRLKFFRFYSQSNCELECLTNATLKLCGCVAFYMPRYNTTRICGADSLYCLEDVAKKRREDDIDAALKASTSGQSSLYFSTKSTCDCLPSCLSISYETDIVKKESDLDTFFLENEIPNATKKPSVAGMVIKFRKDSFVTSRKTELFSRIEFLANCGGFISLFCGFSILSLIEIIYFLTLRLWTNRYRRWEVQAIEPEGCTGTPRGSKQPIPTEPTPGNHLVLRDQGVHRPADPEVQNQGHWRS